MAGVRLLRGREIVAVGNSAPRGKHVYYRIASNRAGPNKRVKDVKLVESESEKETERAKLVVRLCWNENAVRYGSTPEIVINIIIIIIVVVVRRCSFFIDSPPCHSWLAEFLYLALLPRSFFREH
jgi:hypothetical protein